jgi:hypothetical protein
MRLGKFIVAAACAASGVVCASRSEAASLTLNFQGHLTGVVDAPGLLNGLGFNASDTFQFSATLADSTPPPDGDPQSMFGSFAFNGGPSSLTVSGYAFSATKLQIQTTDSTGAPFTDQINLNPYGAFSSTVPSPVHWGGYYLTLDSGDTTTLTTDALDFNSPLWTNYVVGNLNLFFFDDRITGQQFASQVLGVIDSVTLNSAQVPEPGSLMLFGTGAVTLLTRARRRQASRAS